MYLLKSAHAHPHSERWSGLVRCLNVSERKYQSFTLYLNGNTNGNMTEPKKVAFSTLRPIKKEKKRERKGKSLRIKLTLAESNEKSFPEFNYRELVSQKLVSKCTKIAVKVELKGPARDTLLTFYLSTDQCPGTHDKML